MVDSTRGYHSVNPGYQHIWASHVANGSNPLFESYAFNPLNPRVGIIFLHSHFGITRIRSPKSKRTNHMTCLFFPSQDPPFFSTP